MKPTVYVEASVFSYLTARPSRDVLVLARQQITRDWWRDAQGKFELVASVLVSEEVAEGDPKAARPRLRALENVALLEATDEANSLARALLDSRAVPHVAAADAAHISIAVVNGVDFLVTWNFRHIANPAMRSRIETVCRNAGYEPTIICSPDELLEADFANFKD